MNKPNYAEQMNRLSATLPQGTKLLLHSCCAPCSSRCLEVLHEKFAVTVLYYNPNLDTAEEYEKRKAEQKRFLQETGWADFLDCDFAQAEFLERVKGMEHLPERGARCYVCYELRLRKTAETAKAHGFPYFATTLTLSPLKNTEWLNEIGSRMATEYGVGYLPSDFKKQNGYIRSLELSKEYGLYRQNYCGCVFSKREREGS